MGARGDRHTSRIIMGVFKGIRITKTNTCKRVPVATASIP